MPGMELGLGPSPIIPLFDPFPPRKLKIKGLGKHTKNKGQFCFAQAFHSVLVRFHPLSLLLSGQKPGMKGGTRGSQHRGRRGHNGPCLSKTPKTNLILLAPSASTLTAPNSQDLSHTRQVNILEGSSLSLQPPANPNESRISFFVGLFNF